MSAAAQSAPTCFDCCCLERQGTWCAVWLMVCGWLSWWGTWCAVWLMVCGWLSWWGHAWVDWHDMDRELHRSELAKCCVSSSQLCLLLTCHCWLCCAVKCHICYQNVCSSVCLSVCHTSESWWNGSRYWNVLCTTSYNNVSCFLRPYFAILHFGVHPEWVC